VNVDVDPGNPVVKLCAQGMQAECEGRDDLARRLFARAWDERAWLPRPPPVGRIGSPGATASTPHSTAP
jgi:hypothetical protein